MNSVEGEKVGATLKAFRPLVNLVPATGFCALEDPGHRDREEGMLL